MTDKEKEQMALEIYQQMINTLEGVPEKAEIITIVNTLKKVRNVMQDWERATYSKTALDNLEKGRATHSW